MYYILKCKKIRLGFYVILSALKVRHINTEVAQGCHLQEHSKHTEDTLTMRKVGVESADVC